MKKVITIHANDKKKGMSVTEIQTATKRVNQDSTVKAVVNMTGGIKTLSITNVEEESTSVVLA